MLENNLYKFMVDQKNMLKEITEQNDAMGKRLKIVRYIYHEGTRLSSEQFSHTLNITADQLLNYESGRSAVPSSVLVELYNKGINPMFILVGEGDVFVDNMNGKFLKQNIINKNIDHNKLVNDLMERFTHYNHRNKQNNTLEDNNSASSEENSSSMTMAAATHPLQPKS